MPNHIHLIIINEHVGADPCVCPKPEMDIPKKGEHIGSPLNQIVQWFKTMTTNEYIKNIHLNDWKTFNGKLWQRNYYEHIIRNEHELRAYRKYIKDNPSRWEEDEYFV